MHRSLHGVLLLAVLLVPSLSAQPIKESDSKKDSKLKLPDTAKNSVKDRKTTTWCHLHGKLEGDFLHVQADFKFATLERDALVFLGLQGASLTDEGDLDGATPNLLVADDGFVVRVDRDGPHELTLHLILPMSAKQAGVKSFEVGTPGSAGTLVTLQLPADLKEIRWNENIEKNLAKGKFELRTLGRAKKLNVDWKEPIAFPGSGPLTSADANVIVRLEKSYLEIKADLQLTDLRGQTKEWQLLLPTQAKVVPTQLPAGAELVAVEGKFFTHLLKLEKPTQDRQTLGLQFVLPRVFPSQKVQIGPFMAVGVQHARGTILVQAAADALQGQQVFYQRFDKTFQTSVPAATGGVENLAQFQYTNPTPFGKGPNKSHVELELKTEKSPLETQVFHDVKWTSEGGFWLVEIESRFLAKGTALGLDYLDTQLPAQEIPPLPALASNPFQMLAALVHSSDTFWPFSITGPAEDGVVVPDAQRRVRLKLARVKGEDTAEARLVSRYWVTFGNPKVRLDLPRPINVFDRGGKATLTLAPEMDLMVGASGLEEPIGDKHQIAYTSAPTTLDLHWRWHVPEVVSISKADVNIFSDHVEVRQTVSVPSSTRAAKSLVDRQTGKIPVRHATGAQNIKLGPAFQEMLEGDKPVVLIKPIDDGSQFKFEVKYDLPLAKRVDKTLRTFSLPFFWPEGTTRRSAEVRIWTEPGTLPIVQRENSAESWQSRGLQQVEGVATLPALVVEGSGVHVPLTLELNETIDTRLPALMCDRTLIQVQVDDEGNHLYRATFQVRKFTSNFLDIELPLPWDKCQAYLELNKRKVNWSVLDPVHNIVRVLIDPSRYTEPVLFELDYKVPAGQVEHRRFWQTTFYPPKFHQDVFLGKIRWHIGLPTPMVPGALGNVAVDFNWGLSGWLLTPEPAPASAEFDALQGDHEQVDVSLALMRSTLETQRIYHFTRQVWLLACSGLVLIVGLTLYLLPLSRTVFWLTTLLILAVIVTVGMFTPYVLPMVLFGAQPGILVLLLIFAVQMVLQERYRRQLLFMPGFARMQPGSSLMRGQGKKREASTIDSPGAGLQGSNKGPLQ